MQERQALPRPAVALAAALLAVTGFAACAAVAAEHSRFGWERPLLLGIHARASAPGDAVFEDATWLGSIVVLAPIALAVAAALVARGRRYADAGFLLAALGGAFTLTWGLRLVFDRPRPHLWHATSPTPGTSFPSGHSLDSLALGLAFVVLAWPTRRRLPVTLGALAVAAVVGFSRLSTGAHWPSDVLGGWCLALAWVAALALALPAARSRLGRPSRSAAA